MPIHTLPFTEATRFLDFALDKAGRTNFAVQSLGGLRQYLPAYVAEKEQRTEAEAKETRRRHADAEERLQLGYQRYRDAQADRLIAGLPVGDREILEAEARASVLRTTPATRFMGDRLFKVACRRLVLDRYGKDVLSFEDWEERLAA